MTFLTNVQAAVTRQGATLHARVRRIRVLALVLDAWRAYGADQMSSLAAALSYYGLLALFPLLLLLIALAAPFLASEAAIATTIAFVRGYVPTAGSEIEQVLRQVLEARGPATGVGALGLLWSGAGLFDAIQIGVNRAWDVKRARPFWQQRLLSIAMIVLLGAIFATTLAISGVMSSELVNEVFGGGIVRIFGFAFSIALNVILFGVIYRVLPYTQVTWRQVLPGALIVGVVWEIAKLGFVWYVSNFARFSVIYGSVGTIIALLTWGYLTAMLLLFGAEVCAVNTRSETSATVML